MPFKSSEGRNQGKMTRSFDSDYLGGYLLKSAANSQYFYGPNTETTFTVEPGLKEIVIIGVAPGGDGGSNSSTSGARGGGGGAGNVTGYTIPATSYFDQQLYIKVPASPGNPVYVKTGSHSGTSLWEAGHGQPGPSGSSNGGTMVVGPGNSGGNGGPAGPVGSHGSGATGAGSGGGGGGAHNNNPNRGGSGGTTSVPTYKQPLGPAVGPAGPWSMTGSPGGTYGPTQGQAGQDAPNNGAEGHPAANGWPNPNGGSGGGGGGVVLTVNGVAKGYGGGGGGGGAAHGSGYQPGYPSSGGGGFIIIQAVKHT